MRVSILTIAFIAFLASGLSIVDKAERTRHLASMQHRNLERVAFYMRLFPEGCGLTAVQAGGVWQIEIQQLRLDSLGPYTQDVVFNCADEKAGSHEFPNLGEVLEKCSQPTSCSDVQG